MALLIYASISGQLGLLPRCWWLSVGLADVPELTGRFELRDWGLLDFTVWAAGQMVDKEEMKNFEVRMLAAMPAGSGGQ